jgi:hypothetical protein
MSCERALPLLYDLIDDDIDRGDAVWLALHLAECRACAEELAQLRAAESYYAARAAVQPPPELARRIVESVWAENSVRRTDAAWVAVTALVAAAAVIAVLAAGSGAPGALWAAPEEAWRFVVRFFATSPLASPRELLDRLGEWQRHLGFPLPGPPLWRNFPGILAAMVVLQLLGSFWLLAAGRFKRRPERSS